jgi:hypothetical protein
MQESGRLLNFSFIWDYLLITMAPPRAVEKVRPLARRAARSA